jgi:hypothetical protein
LLFAFCDHFEPSWHGAPRDVAEARVAFWARGYPALAADFRDADGHPPRHSFFFPGDEYVSNHLEQLTKLVRSQLGEVELHLHHDGDDAKSLATRLQEHVARYREHGLLGGAADRPRYAFIHGNWCLANSRADGRWCGVDAELRVLHETGCYADFTFPSAPHETQPGIVNQIYWPEGDLARRRAHERGSRARVGELRDDRVLMIQGPLALGWRPARLRPYIENADVRANHPPTRERVRRWVEQEIHVDGRPEWVFVKVHTHGAPEREAASVLGEDGRCMHAALQSEFNDGARWRLHYVTAREMFNIAAAAMDGRAGDPGAYRDYRITPPPAAR